MITPRLHGRQRLRVDQLRGCPPSAGSAARSHRTRARSSPGRRVLDVGRQILRVRIEAEHAHAHRIGHAREAQADRAEADHARPCARRSSTLLCVALSQWPACMRALSVHDRLGAGEQQRQRLLGHGRGIGARRRRRTSMPRAWAATLSIVSVPLPCLEITLQRRRGVHRGGADLAVAHDDRHRIVPLAQRDDVVLGRRLAGEDDLVVAAAAPAPAARGRRR